jgi:hypothetical protein
MRARMSLPVLLLPVLFLPLVMGGCASHRNLGFEMYGTTPGTKYVCRSGSPNCEKSSTEGPIDENPAKTTYFTLPAQTECRGGVHKIFIKNVDTNAPEAVVTCAPEERPAEKPAK